MTLCGVGGKGGLLRSGYPRSDSIAPRDVGAGVPAVPAVQNVSKPSAFFALLL